MLPPAPLCLPSICFICFQSYSHSGKLRPRFSFFPAHRRKTAGGFHKKYFSPGHPGTCGSRSGTGKHTDRFCIPPAMPPTVPQNRFLPASGQARGNRPDSGCPGGTGPAYKNHTDKPNCLLPQHIPQLQRIVRLQSILESG